MSSSEEEERLVQMVHDFMELESPAAPTTTCTSFSHHQHTCLMLEGILRSATDAEMEVFQRALKYVGDLGSERKNSKVKRRLMMRLRTDGFDASLCRSSWLKSPESPGGEYEYIDIVIEKESGSSTTTTTRLILDIDFKSQFELARPTTTYTQLFNTLPPIFVGKEEKLKKVVSLLCSSAQESLKARGLHVPPWRRASYMQSKWLCCCHKVSTISHPNFSTLEVKQERGPNSSSEVRGMGGDVSQRARGSALSSQFSDFSICC